MTSNTAKHHGPSQSQHRKFLRTLAITLQAIRRRPVRAATLASLTGPPLVSLLLDLLGRNGDLRIAVAVSLFLLILIRMLTVMRREARRHRRPTPTMPREPRVGRSDGGRTASTDKANHDPLENTP